MERSGREYDHQTLAGYAFGQGPRIGTGFVLRGKDVGVTIAEPVERRRRTRHKTRERACIIVEKGT